MSTIIPVTCIVTHPICKEHWAGRGHPEAPERLDAVAKTLREAHLMTEKNTVLGRKATQQDLFACHSPKYVQLAKDQCEGAGLDCRMLPTGDTRITSRSFDAALYAAGSVLTGIDQVIKGVAKNAFCLVRPPGHHAFEGAGQGFCLFNNVAIGARYAQRQYGIKKILIVDWDAHHGNGTQAIFYRDPSIFYFSTHNELNYPFSGGSEETGEGEGKGTNLNCPIDPWKNPRAQIKEAFERQLKKAMEQFKPELVLISSGFDAHHSDPLGGLNLEDRDFAHLTRVVMDIADRYAGGRIVSVLEGGYHLEGLSTAVKAHISALGAKKPNSASCLLDSSADMLQATKNKWKKQ